MTENLGVVISDEETPSFEKIRFALNAGKDIKPGALVKCCPGRQDSGTLIARVSAAREWNPNESVGNVTVRGTLGLPANYPQEADSTTIYRIAEAELIEEIINGATRAPETLPKAGAEVSFADEGEIVLSLGLSDTSDKCLTLGHTVGGVQTNIRLKREAIQRHFFIGGTTGSGKSYAMGVLAEELIKQELPMIFIDTQDEYSNLVKKLGGKVVIPGKEINISISSLTESEFLDLLPRAMRNSDLQCDIVSISFNRLTESHKHFSLDDLMEKVGEVAPEICANKNDASTKANLIRYRLRTINYHQIFGRNFDKWSECMRPCLSINCKRLAAAQLQSVATAVLRELQNLRLDNKIPPYVAVIDEAHLFVPEGQDSPCKQIIREGVRIGRHHGICMVLMTQSPVDIDKRTIRQCNTRMVFALEPDQLDAIRGVKADASDEMLRALPKMPRGTCVLSGTYESVKHAVTVKIRERKTEDSEGGATPDIFGEMEKQWKTQNE